jgi:hypothetical protein
MPQWDFPGSFPYSIYECERPYDQALPLTRCGLHEPLESPDHFRLLKLYPPGWPERLAEKLSYDEDTNIKCEVYQVSLASITTAGRPYFATLSYAWGDPKPVRQVRCAEKLVSITQSLYDALVYIRHLRTPRLVWVDSLCIDQTNATEKSQQVQRMHLIYGQSHCISWLGVEREDRDDLGNMLPILGWLSEQEEMFTSHGMKATWDSVDENLHRNPIQNYTALDQIPWVTLYRCLDRGVFTRLWCLQEMLLAKSNDLRTSQSHLSISILARACYLVESILRDIIFKQGADSQPDFQSPVLSNLQYKAGAISRMLKAVLLQGEPLPCIKFKRPTKDDTQAASTAAVVMAFHWKECSNPRDRIYGLAALCNLGPSYQIVYSKQLLSVQEVFTNFAQHCFKETGSLELFGAPYRLTAIYDSSNVIQSQKHRVWTSGLPSWCPDFAGPYPRLRNLKVQQNERVFRLKACRGQPARFTQMSHELLGVTGICIGTVQKRSIAWRHSRPDEDLTEWHRDDLARAASFLNCVSSISVTVPPLSLWKLYLSVCSAGTDLRHSPPWTYIKGHLPSNTRDRMVLDTVGAAWIMIYAPNLAPKDGLTLSQQIDPSIWKLVAEEIEVWLRRKSFGTRLFTTENANAILGTGPDALDVGDVVCVLFGSEVPLILRQVGDQGQYKLIGECYVEGIMHGEGLDMGFDEREFLLI